MVQVKDTPKYAFAAQQQKKGYQVSMESVWVALFKNYNTLLIYVYPWKHKYAMLAFPVSPTMQCLSIKYLSRCIAKTPQEEFSVWYTSLTHIVSQKAESRKLVQEIKKNIYIF